MSELNGQLVVRRNDGESWRDAVERIASKHGLENECTEYYDRFIASGDTEERAAFDALYEWDCVDFEDHANA